MDLLAQNGLRSSGAGRDRWLEAKQAIGEHSVDGRPSDQAPSKPSEGHWALLARTIEAEIIPRLMQAHCRADAIPPTESAAEALGSNAVDCLSRFVLANERCAALSHVQAMLAAGASIESLCADLLVPAARHVGGVWEADLGEFAEISLALWRMQQLREFGPLFQDHLPSGGYTPRLLLAPAPGDEHTLGLCMIAEFFRRAGWRVYAGPPSPIDRLCDVVARETIDVLALSIRCESRLDALGPIIRALRQASRQSCIGVMVGGPLHVQAPELVDLLEWEPPDDTGQFATLPHGHLATCLRKS